MHSRLNKKLLGNYTLYIVHTIGQQQQKKIRNFNSLGESKYFPMPNWGNGAKRLFA